MQPARLKTLYCGPRENELKDRHRAWRATSIPGVTETIIAIGPCVTIPSFSYCVAKVLLRCIRVNRFRSDDQLARIACGHVSAPCHLTLFSDLDSTHRFESIRCLNPRCHPQENQGALLTLHQRSRWIIASLAQVRLRRAPALSNFRRPLFC